MNDNTFEFYRLRTLFESTSKNIDMLSDRPFQNSNIQTEIRKAPLIHENGFEQPPAIAAHRTVSIGAKEQNVAVSSVKSRLRELWAIVMNDDPSTFDDEDEFFTVGGDSRSAQALVTIARQNGISLTMQQIFMHGSLVEMAEVAQLVEIKRDLTAISSDLKPFELLKRTGSVEQSTQMIAQACSSTPEHIENAYPCSPMQEALITEIDGGTNSYVRQFVFLATSTEPLDQLRTAWKFVVESHPILRTRMCQIEDAVGYIQVVMKDDFMWSTVQADLDQFLAEDARAPMRIGNSLSRYTVVEPPTNNKDGRMYFVWTIHHAICDGTSIPEILEDVARQLQHESMMQRQPFESFIESIATANKQAEEREYWVSSLQGIHPGQFPIVPPDLDFQARPSSLFERALEIDPSPVLGFTKPLFIQAAWAILLSHYTGSEDVSFGAINNGRYGTLAGVETMTGPTINLIPVAMNVDTQLSVASFLSQVLQQTTESVKFQHTGLSKIRQYLADTNTAVVDFQSLFVVQPAEFSDIIATSMEKLQLEYVHELGKKEQHGYPLVATFTLATETTIRLMIEHDERLLSTQQARNLSYQFHRVLEQLLQAGKSTPLSSISLFSEYDMFQIREWNKFTPSAEETCIHDLFQKRSKQQPNATAVCSVSQSFTYSEVDQFSSSVAVCLRKLGVRRGSYVAVCFEKSVWTVVAILAVFKAGGVYVPLDPAHPRGRIQDVIQTVQIKLAVTSTSGADVLRGMDVDIFTIDCPPAYRFWEEESLECSPSDTAYLLFTSGSTGKPKGILMSHRAICTSIVHHGAAYGAGTHWRTLQFGAHTFDLSIGEFFTTLTFGGCICVPSEHERLNDLAGAITALNANTLLVVPTVANLILPVDAPTLKTIVLAGEPITKETIQRWADHVDLTAGYGPSETAVYCSGNLRISTDAHPAHIGGNIGGTMWIADLDNYHQLTAVGCVGEIVISGAILGDGYFSDQVATDAAFVSPPAWFKDFDSAGIYQAVYKSGDLARYNPDGTLHIVGRRDTQVKLHGYRIELGEIENQIMAFGTATAAFTDLPTSGPCARKITTVLSFHQLDLDNHSNPDISVARNIHSVEMKELLRNLKHHLTLNLPEYMVPTIWIVLEKMPHLLSGKIDRKTIKTWVSGMNFQDYRALSDDVGSGKATEIVPGSLTDTLRQIWSEVLGIMPELIDTETSFFAFGGDSLAAIQLITQAKSKHIRLTVRGVLRAKNLGHLAEMISDQGSNTEISSSPPRQNLQSKDILLRPYQSTIDLFLKENSTAKVEDAYPLSPFQREVLKQRVFNPAVFIFSWYMEIVSRVSQPIQLERLVKAWKLVVKKYPVLRSKVLQDPSGKVQPIQVVLSNIDGEIAVSSASATDPEPTFATLGLRNIDESRLLQRAHFIKHGDSYFIHVEIDHTMIDGLSLMNIKRSILEAYESNDLYIPQHNSYKDFIAAHTPSRVDADNQHWASVLRDQKPSLLSLSSTSWNLKGSSDRFGTVLNLPDIKTPRLATFSARNDITAASVFSAAWAQTLSKYTHSEDIAFEYIVSGRDEDISGALETVGALVNSLPYHLRGISSDDDLGHLARQMQEQQAEDMAHSTSNVREVIEKILGLSPLSNTAVNFHRRPGAAETATLRIDDCISKTRDPWHFDVLVRILHVTDDDTYKPSLEFDCTLSDQDRMREVAEDWIGRVNAVASQI